MVFGVFGAAGDWQSKADEMAEHENCKRRTVRECLPRRRHAKLEALLPACVPACLPHVTACLLPVCRVSLPACCVPRVGSRLLATVAARHLKRFVSHLLLFAAASSVRTHQANSVEAQYYKCVVHGQPLRKHPNGSNGGGGDRMRYSYELEMMVRN
eukprot:COSAG06_NODE_12781_length_1330_cov_19.741673_1_plen_156_part_00